MNLDQPHVPSSQPRGGYWAFDRSAEAHSSPSSSPRGETFSSTSEVNSLGSAGSLTSYSSVESVGGSPHGPVNSYCSYPPMMATQGYGAPPPHPGYMDHGHAPTSAPSYSHYGHSGPLLPPAMNTYPAQGYPAYTYAQPVSTPATHPGHYAPLPPTMLPPTMPSNQTSSSQVPYGTPHTPDTTGQVAPPNAKPKLTGTVWEDEGTVCFQVEVRGICVARREDNCFINGTKLLNVANMTRGRRDGILKSEKVKNVVKIGPMHLKGVWIPFERALEFANKEKITEQLYPLFVSNISPLLAPQFQSQLPSGRRQTTSQPGQSQPGQPQPAQLRTPQQQTQSQPPPPAAQTPTSVPPQSSGGRPEMNRAHTFPTPPQSATSTSGQAPGNYNWDQPHHQALHLETGLHNPKSMPTTPTTTPPESHYHGAQAYDARYSSYYGSHMAPPQKKEEEDRKDHAYGNYSYTDPHAPQASPGKAYAPADNSRQPDGSAWTNGNYASHRSVPSSNLAYVIGDNAPPHHDPYTTYANGVNPMPPKKRGREDDDELDNPHKRKMTFHENDLARPRSAVIQRS